MKQMKSLFINLLTVCTLIFFTACKNIESNCNKSTSEKIEQVICNYVKKWDYKPAISVSVISKMYELNYNYANGFSSISNKTKNEVQTPHFVYSITKSFIASAILKLKNEGKLSLEDSISKYIQNINTIYINSNATIKELLSHRSGISDYTENPALIYNNPFSKSNDWNAQTILSFVEKPSESSGNFLYSSTNYILLGMIIEKITNEKVNIYLNKKISSPMNISVLLYPEDEVDLTKVSHPHCYPNTFMEFSGDGKTPIDIADIIPNVLELLGKCGWTAGGIVSTAKEISKWGYNLLSFNGTIEKELREEIINSVSLFTDKNTEQIAYGYGIRKLFYKDYEFLGSYGRSIGDENLMFYNKDKDVCIVILTSSNMKKDKTPNIDSLMYEIFECI